MKKTLIFLFALLVLLQACDEPIHVTLPDYDSKMVIYGMLETNADDIPKIYVSESQSYFDYADQQNFGYKAIEDAEVTLSVDDENYPLVLTDALPYVQEIDTFWIIDYYTGDTLDYIISNWYIYQIEVDKFYTIDKNEFPDFKIENGKTYNLTASSENYNITASATSENEIEISNARFERDTIRDTYIDGYYEYASNKLIFEIQDIPNQRDGFAVNYELKYYYYIEQNGQIIDSVLQTLTEESSNYYNISNDTGNDGQVIEIEFEINNLPDYYEYYEYNFDGFSSTSEDLNFPATTFELTYQIVHYNEATLNYFESVNAQNNNEGNPFVEPTFINGNIENGLGLFAAKTQNETLNTLNFICCD